MTLIYAAIIEWPYSLSDADPTLILARTAQERDAKIADEIRETADALTEPDWRNVIAATHHSNHWTAWMDGLEATRYDRPTITTYEREFWNMSTATFTPYDMGNSEDNLHAHAGERVEILAPLELGHDEFKMFQAVTNDGVEIEAFEDELTDWSDK